MSTSIMIHDVSSVTAGTVHHSNANSVSVRIESVGGYYDLTLFGLSTEKAEALSDALQPLYARRKSEDEIRADERRKIASRIGVA